MNYSTASVQSWVYSYNNTDKKGTLTQDLFEKDRDEELTPTEESVKKVNYISIAETKEKKGNQNQFF